MWVRIMAVSAKVNAVQLKSNGKYLWNKISVVAVVKWQLEF